MRVVRARILVFVLVLLMGMGQSWAASPVHVDRELDVEDYVLPAGLIIFSNLVFWGWGRLVLNSDYSDVTPSTIARNFREGWEWDDDAFATNQLGHPYQGQLYFAAARASGHDFWVSGVYTFFGSLQWEYFMENELPSYNDLITTTFGGIAVGEALYRLSANLLEPDSSGGERIAREVGAGLLTPTHGLSRVINGEVNEHRERVEDWPSRGAIMVGPDLLRSDTSTISLRSLRFGLLVEYGELQQTSNFRPFDWFTLSSSLNLFEGKPQRGQIDILGLLARWKFDCGGTCVLGLNQHYAYIDTPIFKVGTSSVGASLMGEFEWQHFRLRTGAHADIIALGGFSSLTSADFALNYSLGPGGMVRAFGALRWMRNRDSGWFNHFELRAQNTRYFLRSLNGLDGNEYAGVTSGHLHVPIYGNLGLVFGVDVYDRQTVPDVGENIFSSYYTEQLFLLWKL